MSDKGTQANENGRNKDLAAVHNNMLDGLGQLTAYFGFSKVVGQIYGALYLSPEPLCLDDLMECLDISKASVSMNMRTLEHIGMVRQVWVRGEGNRRKYYTAEADFWQIISNVLSGREMRDLERALTVMDDDVALLSESKDQMESGDKELTEFYLERIGQIQALFRFAQLIITSILARGGELNLDDISQINIE